MPGSTCVHCGNDATFRGTKAFCSSTGILIADLARPGWAGDVHPTQKEMGIDNRPGDNMLETTPALNASPLINRDNAMTAEALRMVCDDRLTRGSMLHEKAVPHLGGWTLLAQCLESGELTIVHAKRLVALEAVAEAARDCGTFKGGIQIGRLGEAIAVLDATKVPR